MGSRVLFLNIIFGIWVVIEVVETLKTDEVIYGRAANGFVHL